MRKAKNGSPPLFSAIYVRVSKHEQNPEYQKLNLIDYAERNNYKIYKIYTDIITGKSSSRPALNDMLFDARSKHFSVVICYKLDRLGRSLKHLINITEEWQKQGIDFICTSQDIDTTTPNGKLIFHILGAISEFERELISERTKTALKYAKNVGKRGKDKKPRRKSGYYLRWNKR